MAAIHRRQVKSSRRGRITRRHIPATATISYCYINFPQLPASKLVRFEKVNCRIVVNNDIITAYIGVADTDLAGLKRVTPVKVEKFLERDNKKYFSIESDVIFLAGQGKYIRVYLETFESATSTNRCTLIGKTMTSVPTD